MTLLIHCSTVADGPMKTLDGDYVAARRNRAEFAKKCGINPAGTTLHTLSYGGDDFCRYETLDDSTKGDGIVRESSIDADAVAVTKPGHALLLPLADCIGAVIHDPTCDVLMISHLGRHNLEQHGGAKCIQYLAKTHGCDPKALKVWLSPAAGQKSYPLYAFENRSLHDVATEQLLAAGILPVNITSSPIDSATYQDYYSHSQFLKGNKTEDGRFAVVAVLSEN
jgi:copper oxidase (laccase) domain-containing protein